MYAKENPYVKEIGDYVVIDQKAVSRVQADPSFPRERYLCRLGFKKQKFQNRNNTGGGYSRPAAPAAATPTNPAASWVPVDYFHPAPLDTVRVAVNIAKTAVNDKFPNDFKRYNLVAYMFTDASNNELYLKIELNPFRKPSPLYVYVSLSKSTHSRTFGVERIEDYDFLHNHRNLVLQMQAISANPPASSHTQDWGYPVDKSHPAPQKVDNAANLARSAISNKFHDDFNGESYRLVKYTDHTLEKEKLRDYELYMKIMINSKPILYAYVLYDTSFDSPNPVERIEKYDFLHQSPDTHARTQLAEGFLQTTSESITAISQTQSWTDVTEFEDAPSDVQTAAYLAEHYVKSYWKEVLRYILKAYKKVPKEKGYAVDFFLKVDIGAASATRCVFVKLFADHHGAADNVEMAEFDFSAAGHG